MGFTSIWITPVVDNPDEAFTGGTPPSCGSILTDQGKSGYHGYWGVDFHKVDEHLPSPGLDFAGLAKSVHAKDMKLVLDIVGNHGSPGWTMPKPQPKFGKVYGKDGALIAIAKIGRLSNTPRSAGPSRVAATICGITMNMLKMPM